jgi:hypothetical protein
VQVRVTAHLHGRLAAGTIDTQAGPVRIRSYSNARITARVLQVDEGAARGLQLHGDASCSVSVQHLESGYLSVAHEAEDGAGTPG